MLVGLLFAKPPTRGSSCACCSVLFALMAIFYMVRTGHLGAELAWGPDAEPRVLVDKVKEPLTLSRLWPTPAHRRGRDFNRFYTAGSA